METVSAVVAAGMVVVDSLVQAFQVNGQYNIACVVANLTSYHLTLIPGIRNHHGQYGESPVNLSPIPPTVSDEENIHSNISCVEIHSSGARCSESVWGYKLQDDDGAQWNLCLYMKHGKQVEAGCAVWKDGCKVGKHNYDDMIHNSAADLIHVMQHGRMQTAYSRNGEACNYLVEGLDLNISFAAGKKFSFIIKHND